MSLRHKLGTALRLPWADRWLLAETTVWLGLGRLAVAALPFRWIAPRLGQHMAESSHEKGDVASLAVLRRVSWAMRIMSRDVPWGSRCLDQAIAAHYMLRRRGLTSTLYLGVAKAGEAELEAHAWLRSGPFYLIGGRGRQRYTVVATFAWEKVRRL
jgi:hypothetical protein